ncbi:MAG: hypothetical protein ABIW81_06530 [Terrimesophilobacter sp.]
MIDEQRLSAIAAVADTLIPPADGFLSGAQAGIPGHCLNAAVEARPDLVPTLDEAVAEISAGTSAPDLVARWSTERPDSFDSLFLLVRGAYFLNHQVCQRLHYDGVTAHPLSQATAPDYLDLVETVVASGPRYRNINSGSKK